MQQLYGIYYIFQLQKRIVVGTIIQGNRVVFIPLQFHEIIFLALQFDMFAVNLDVLVISKGQLNKTLELIESFTILSGAN